jgi:hypothetical protein
LQALVCLHVSFPNFPPRPKNVLYVMECAQYRSFAHWGACQQIGQEPCRGESKFLNGQQNRHNALYSACSITDWFSWFVQWACGILNDG